MAVITLNQVLLGMSKGSQSLGIQESKIDKTLLRENNNQESIPKHIEIKMFVALPWGDEGGKHEAHNTRHTYVWCHYV